MSHCLPSSERISFILTYFTFSCYVSHALCCATRAHICGHVLFQTTGVSPSSFRSVQVPWMRSQYPLFRLVYWDVQIRFIPFSPFIPLCISTCFSSICFLSVCLPTSSVMSDSCYDGGLTRRLKIFTWWRASKKRRFFFSRFSRCVPKAWRVLSGVIEFFFVSNSIFWRSLKLRNSKGPQTISGAPFS